MHWRDIHIGFQNDGLTIGGLKVWKQEWRPVAAEPVILPHPAYPNQMHRYSQYEIGPLDEPVRFAVDEVSAGVYGFYVPDP